MIGQYDNFPPNIHFLESFSSILTVKKLQERLVETLKDFNRKPFSFEEISIPTIPNGEVIFEFGIAEGEGFNFLNEEETNRALDMLKTEQVAALDFFCAIRYYKRSSQKKTALKFDYYMFKVSFAAKHMEIQVFHKQGPRYISPKELANIIVDKINDFSSKRVLKKNESENADF